MEHATPRKRPCTTEVLLRSQRYLPSSNKFPPTRLRTELDKLVCANKAKELRLTKLKELEKEVTARPQSKQLLSRRTLEQSTRTSSSSAKDLSLAQQITLWETKFFEEDQYRLYLASLVEKEKKNLGVWKKRAQKSRELFELVMKKYHKVVSQDLVANNNLAIAKHQRQQFRDVCKQQAKDRKAQLENLRHTQKDLQEKIEEARRNVVEHEALIAVRLTQKERLRKKEILDLLRHKVTARQENAQKIRRTEKGLHSKTQEIWQITQ